MPWVLTLSMTLSIWARTHARAVGVPVQDQAALSMIVDRVYGLDKGGRDKGRNAINYLLKKDQEHCVGGPIQSLGVALHKDEALNHQLCEESLGHKVKRHQHLWH